MCRRRFERLIIRLCELNLINANCSGKGSTPFKLILKYVSKRRFRKTIRPDVESWTPDGKKLMHSVSN